MIKAIELIENLNKTTLVSYYFHNLTCTHSSNTIAAYIQQKPTYRDPIFQGFSVFIQESLFYVSQIDF